MIASFILALREGLEAALIVGLLLGGLRKIGHLQMRRTVWMGVSAAVLVSLLAGLLLQQLGAGFTGRTEQIFEGTTMLLAAGILAWVILWLGRNTRSANRQLQSDVSRAVGQGSSWALFFMAFLAVVREGVELALFLTAAGFKSEVGALLGAALGLVAAALVSVLLFRSLIQLDLGRFFRISSLILVLFAAGLAAHGVHEFNEAGLIPPIIEPLWDINHILDENSGVGQFLKALLGYNGNPSLAEVITYLAYLGAAISLDIFSRRKGVHIGSD